MVQWLASPEIEVKEESTARVNRMLVIETRHVVSVRVTSNHGASKFFYC